MRVALISEKNAELSPLRITDRDLLSMLDLVYDPLIRLDDDRRPTPALASSWQVSSDGTTWTFTIRDNVYFHDGNELTAYDVKATLDALKALADDSSLPSNEKGIFSLVTNSMTHWQADDKRTLTIRTNKPSYSLLYAMTFPILQAQAIYTANPPGTGPYQITYFNPGDEMWLSAFPGWYGMTPYVNEIIGIWYDDAEEALRAYEAEQVDIVMTRSAAALRYRGTLSSRTNAYTYATRQLECLLINNYGSTLANQDMRAAILRAINKTQLMTSVYQSNVGTTYTLQSPSSWLYNEEAEKAYTRSYSYDPAESAKLLDSLGWDSYDSSGQYRIKRSDDGSVRELSLRLNYYNDSEGSLRKEAANAIAAMLRAVGIRVSVTMLSFENAAAKLTSGDYDLFLCAYNFDVVPDPSFLLVSKSTLEGNYARYNSKDMSTLCANLLKAADADAFQQAWYAIQMQFTQDIPFLPLYWRQGTILTRYPYSNVRDIREYELLRSINEYNR